MHSKYNFFIARGALQVGFRARLRVNTTPVLLRVLFRSRAAHAGTGLQHTWEWATVQTLSLRWFVTGNENVHGGSPSVGGITVKQKPLNSKIGAGIYSEGVQRVKIN